MQSPFTPSQRFIYLSVLEEVLGYFSRDFEKTRVVYVRHCKPTALGKQRKPSVVFYDFRQWCGTDVTLQAKGSTGAQLGLARLWSNADKTTCSARSQREAGSTAACLWGAQSRSPLGQGWRLLPPAAAEGPCRRPPNPRVPRRPWGPPSSLPAGLRASSCLLSSHCGLGLPKEGRVSAWRPGEGVPDNRLSCRGSVVGFVLFGWKPSTP